MALQKAKGKKETNGVGRDKGLFYNMAEKERCILCGELTEVSRNCPLPERNYYIEGAGQLCRRCYLETYMPLCNEDMIQIEYLSRKGSGHNMEGRDGRNKA